MKDTYSGRRDSYSTWTPGQGSAGSERFRTTWSAPEPGPGRYYPRIREEEPGALRRFAMRVRQRLTGRS